MILSPLGISQLGTDLLGDISSRCPLFTREIREVSIGDEPESSSGGVWSKSFKKTFLRAGSVKMSAPDIDVQMGLDGGPKKRRFEVPPLREAVAMGICRTVLVGDVLSFLPMKNVDDP